MRGKTAMDGRGPSRADEARAVLMGNDEGGRWTRPSPRLYPHLWLWDSCFIAIGLAHFDVPRARQELRSALEAQWPDGLLPHIRFNPREEGYFPGPDVWRSPEGRLSSAITQPPMPAIALMELHRRHPDTGFLEEVFEPVAAYHEYLSLHRGRDLLFIIHPWESGLDNSPLYDDALLRVPVDRALVLRRRDDSIVDPAQRPSKRFYEKYIALVNSFAGKDHAIDAIAQTSPFLIQDVLFNALWCEANRCLGVLAEALGREGRPFFEQSRRTRDAMRREMCRDGLYHPKDLREGRLIEGLACTLIAPLFAGVASEQEADKAASVALRDLHLRHGICSYDPRAPQFDPVCYWRGPVWVNINWMAVRGLQRYGHIDEAESLRRHTLELIDENGFFEYFDPHSGAGCGGESFSWTAALYLDLLDPAATPLARGPV